MLARSPAKWFSGSRMSKLNLVSCTELGSAYWERLTVLPVLGEAFQLSRQRTPEQVLEEHHLAEKR